ncbi:MAG: flippase activity-associated protein Agl23 [Desulfatitalea sp.]
MHKPNLQLKEYAGFLGIAAIAAAWLFLLMYDLSLRPPHHDEGVNGWYVMQMWRHGFFRYDPSNYHGPLFFYLLQLSETLFGKGIVSLRLVTVCFAILNTLLVIAHRRFFGRIALWAALVMAFSPAALFYGRYAIHETVFIFFQLIFSYGYFTYTRRISWRIGVVSMTAGFFGTVLIKETFFIFFGTWLIAHFLVAVMARFLPETTVQQEARPPAVKGKRGAAPFAPPEHWFLLAQTVCAGALVTLIIYSGFLMNPRGIADMVTALAPWLKTGMESGHEKPFFYWLKLMRTYEWTALAALAAAVVIGWWTSRSGRFWCAVAAGTVLAYSLIPYKTPWLILNLLWPLCFVFGYALETIRQAWPAKGKAIAYTAAALLVLAGAGLAARLNFLHPADSREAYVYTHSHPSINQLVTRIERVCAVHPEAKNMTIVVATEQTWPFPWTLSDYPAVRYEGFKAGQSLQGDVLIVDIKDQRQVESRLETAYYKVEGKLRDAYTDIVYYFREARFKDTWQGAGTLIVQPSARQEPSS